MQLCPVGDGLGPPAEPPDVMQARWLRLLDATRRAPSRMRAARLFRCGAAVSIQAWRRLDVNRSGIEGRPQGPESWENGFSAFPAPIGAGNRLTAQDLDALRRLVRTGDQGKARAQYVRREGGEMEAFNVHGPHRFRHRGKANPSGG